MCSVYEIRHIMYDQMSACGTKWIVRLGLDLYRNSANSGLS